MTFSVMQALATGLPCIVTRHSAFPDQVIDGMNGYLVDEGDYQALADAILRFMNEPAAWPRMSEYARQHVAATYDSTVLAEKQIALYRSLIAA